MSKRLSLAAGILSLAVSTVAFGAAYTVDSTGILDPNPSNLGITEVGNTSLATARTLISAAHTAGIGGTIDFQQQGQGGTFPNSTSATNGQDFANGPTNPLSVTASSSGGVATGPTIFQFYRLESTGVGATNGANNFDSNLNQGGNVISGGFNSRYPGAVTPENPLGDGSAVSGTNPNAPLSALGSISGGYIGITDTGSPATMVFDSTPLSFFGITALPRGATRDTLITLTEVPVDGNGIPVVGGTPISVPIGAATVVGTNAVFFGQTANVGYAITRAAFTNPNAAGVNRYDDLAFVLSTVPEPASLGLIGLAGTALLRRRRA